MQNSMALGRTVRDSQQPQKTVRDMQQLYGTGETVRDSQLPIETVREIQQLWTIQSLNIKLLIEICQLNTFVALLGIFKQKHINLELEN